MRLNNFIITAGILFAAGGANAAKQCMPCANGKWSIGGKCDQNCEAGYYCNGGSKIRCAAGEYCPAGSSMASLCQPGYKCPNGVPIRCDNGKEYQDEEGQLTCKSCGNLAVNNTRTGCIAATTTYEWTCRKDYYCDCKYKNTAGVWSTWVYTGNYGWGGDFQKYGNNKDFCKPWCATNCNMRATQLGQSAQW